jgi:hypothetical protein
MALALVSSVLGNLPRGLVPRVCVSRKPEHLDQDNELIGYDLRHDLTAYPSGFTIGLSQAIDRPFNPSPVDVAVDSVIVTSGNTTITSSTAPAVEISWSSVAGKYYQIQWLQSGKPSQWVNLGDPLPGSGSTMSIFEPAVGHQNISYRVQVLP